jgi:signal transduction histidine kinase
MELTIGSDQVDTAMEVLDALTREQPWTGVITARTVDEQIISIHLIDLPIVAGDIMVGVLGLAFDTRAPGTDISDGAARLTALTTLADAVADGERRKLGRIVHDELGQLIAALQTELHRVQSEVIDETAVRSIGELLLISNEMLNLIRTVSAELRPPPVPAGPIARIEATIGDFTTRCGVPVDSEISDRLVTLSPRLGDLAIDIVRQCLTNIERHADAKRVVVAVRVGARIEIVVADDGVGMDPAATRGLGITYMTERVEEIGGSLRITSTPHRGTKVRVQIPMP